MNRTKPVEVELRTRIRSLLQHYTLEALGQLGGVTGQTVARALDGESLLPSTVERLKKAVHVGEHEVQEHRQSGRERVFHRKVCGPRGSGDALQDLLKNMQEGPTKVAPSPEVKIPEVKKEEPSRVETPEVRIPRVPDLKIGKLSKTDMRLLEIYFENKLLA